MAVGLGFVSICLSEKACSPAGNVTVATLRRLPDGAARIGRIRRTALRNLGNTLRVLHFLEGNGLQLYRFATHLVPLATHPCTEGWAWWCDPQLQPLLDAIGRVIRAQGLRVSTHPPPLCALNAPQGLRWAVAYGEYHARLLEAMGLDETAKIVLHPGRDLGSPEANVRCAVQAVGTLPDRVRARLALENDDRVFSAAQTLEICRQTGLPMVFDFHHHACRNDGEDFRDLLPGIFATWHDRPPKVHLSSPSPGRDGRGHADYVDPAFVGPFLRHAASLGDVDAMVEAKAKDLAALKLRGDFPDIWPPRPRPGSAAPSTAPPAGTAGGSGHAPEDAQPCASHQGLDGEPSR